VSGLPSTTVLKDIPWNQILHYFTGDVSLFRHYQNTFLERFASRFTGEVIELGCEKSYNHRRFFVNSSNYRCSNITRDYDEYLDITQMTTIESNSVAGYVCVSVLEHVPDFKQALSEIHRTLAPGGLLLLTVPFMFPVHDEVDYWRFSNTFYKDFFEQYDIEVYAHFGGTLSTTATLLQRPKKSLKPRYLFYKLFGFFLLITAKFVDRVDACPLGIGIVAVKNR
jgi:SAM-dependent methyltransferase